MRCDGDLSQIDAIKQLVEVYIENKIIANKENAAQSGVEQPADLACVFKIIKNIQKIHTITVRDIPSDRCRMKKIVNNIFKLEKMKFLLLKLTK